MSWSFPTTRSAAVSFNPNAGSFNPNAGSFQPNAPPFVPGGQGQYNPYAQQQGQPGYNPYAQQQPGYGQYGMR